MAMTRSSRQVAANSTFSAMAMPGSGPVVRSGHADRQYPPRSTTVAAAATSGTPSQCSWPAHPGPPG